MERLFFAVEVNAPWPQKLPHGRILDESSRHMTLAFIGNVNAQDVMTILPSIPPLPIKVGMTGAFNKVLFLPPRHPRVVAWQVQWWDNPDILASYHKELVTWLSSYNLIDAKELERPNFLHHVTLARAPFAMREWKSSFIPLPVQFQRFHLYESVGNLKYVPRWSSEPLLPPYEEIEHTADLAFKIRGESAKQLYNNSLAALSFRFPPIVAHFQDAQFNCIEEVIISLNEAIALEDALGGCPFKAVSFHGEIKEQSDGTLLWEMIVDV